MAARGIRNNNPLNIRKTGIKWLGEILGSDNAFEQFQSLVYGLRAGMVNIKTYFGRGKNTITEIITSWAPPSDGNNTKAYIKTVSERSGIPANQKLTFDKKTIIPIVKAMVFVENGSDAGITAETYEKAFDAIKDKTVKVDYLKYVLPLLVFFYSIGCFTAPLITNNTKNKDYVTKDKRFLPKTENRC